MVARYQSQMSNRSVKNLIPHFVQEKELEGIRHGSFDAYTMFVDLSGFTRLTETLLRQGKAGAERLSKILNAIFGPMVGKVYANGGFIPYFAGDAFTGIFTKEKSSVDAQQLLLLAIALHAELKAAAAQFEEFQINIKTGLSVGPVEWGIVGQERKSFYFRGAAINGCAYSQQQAGQDEIILDTRLFALLEDINGIVPMSTPGYFQVEKKHFTSLPGSQLNDKRIVPENISKKIASKFLPEAVLQFNQQGEFRTVVSLFISFEGVDTHAELNEFATVVLDQMHNFAGYFKEIDFGDKGGVMVAIFGAPVSYENNVERALEFVCALHEELLPIAHAQVLRYKIGIANGIAYTGIVGGEERCQYAAVGNRVNIAARLMMHAGWGEVWVDEEVQKSRHFQFLHKGNITYKGLDEKIPSYQLAGRNIEQSQNFEGSMVGRKQELEKLEELVATAFQRPEPIVAYIYGEAGIGKTRLAFELKNYLRHKNKLRWFSCRSDQILHKPFNPFIYFLKDYFGQSSDNNHTTNFDNFERRFSVLLDELMGPDNPESENIRREVIRTKPVLAELTGLKTSNSLWENLDAKGRYINTFAALTALFQAEALIRPIVIELEDGHWYDESSIEFLNDFIGKIKNLPIFLLVTSRYDDEGNKPRLFDSQTLVRLNISVHEIDLNFLEANALKAFAVDRLQGGINPDLFDLLLRTTNGNPFYAEQMLEYFIESEQLLKVEGKWSIKDKNVRISDSIQAVLTARIDRLSSLVKETIKAAAVIGREFELPVLTEVMKVNEEFTRENGNMQVVLRDQIKTAERAQIWQAMNELRYIFRHSLLREAVYDMQLRTRLQSLHHLIAQAIESLYAKNLEQRYVDLVFHYEQAEIEDKLKDYLQKAADHAKAHYQNSQALHFYNKLIKLIDKDGVNESERMEKTSALLKKGSILELIGQWEECENIYREALELARGTNDARVLGRANNSLGNLLMLKGRYEEADGFLETAAAFFGSIHDNRGTSKVYGNLGTLYFRQGKYEDAKLYFIRSIQLAQLYKHVPSNAQIVATLGLTYMNLGKYDDGIRWQQSQLDLCKRVNDRQGMATLYTNMGIVHFEKGDYDAALTCYERGLELSEELGNKQLTSIAIGCIGTVWQRKGKFDLAKQHFEKDLALTEELGDKQGICIALGLIGELHSVMGHFDEAIGYMQRNLKIGEELGYKKGVAKSLNTLGDIYFYKNELDTSLAYYDRCIEVTRNIGNKLVLGLSLVEKGTVLITIGQHKDAEAHLTEALKLARELNQPDLLFEAQMLEAKIAAATGNTTAAMQALDRLLAKQPGKKDEAAIYFELEKLRPDGTYKAKALALYKELYQNAPVYVYQLRIQELEKG